MSTVFEIIDNSVFMGSGSRALRSVGTTEIESVRGGS